MSMQNITRLSLHSFFVAALLLISSYSHSSINTATRQATIESTQAQQKATIEILQTLDQRHFVDIEVNDALSARFLNNYLEQLDPNKSIFIQSDIDEFTLHQFSLDDELKKGENATGFKIYSRLQERLSKRLTSVIASLKSDEKPIDFTINEEISLDNDENGWPKTSKEADEIWRKRVKSFFLTKKLADEPIDKSRKTLLKRYNDQLTRIQKTSAEDIYEIYINAFTELYDPHTNYFSPRTSETFSIRMSLSLEGIGAVLQSEDGYTKVVRIVTGGPADKQGQLKPADKISGVAQGEGGDMVDVVGWRLDEVVDLIRGDKDSIVRLEVSSSGITDESKKIIQIKRDKVKLEDQAAQKAVINLKDEGQNFKVGVINIPTFYLDFDAYRQRDPNYRSTTKDVHRLITELENEGVDGIVVDLRNNGGGSLYEATAVTDLFIDKGPVVQIGKDGGQKISDYSQNNARYRGPLVVLINRLSASASEIFAGAIQDYHRGLVVGSQSFGKGTVQTLTPLKSQGDLKITESKFYRVSGDSTQHRGVIPDILMPELIDITEVGESSYATALSWSKTLPERYGTYFSLNELIEQLSQQHNQRIDANPDFIYLNERKSLLAALNKKKTVSLQESKRLKEKASIEMQSLAIENKRRLSKGLTAYANFSEYKDETEKENIKRAANAGATTIDIKNDAILSEAGYILKDFINQLKKSPKQVALTP
ncbi:MAG: carboxyl-terminal processing protease [Candidatus Endobugula sp.]|jgi:carboxyl-terminal processing protease